MECIENFLTGLVDLSGPHRWGQSQVWGDWTLCALQGASGALWSPGQFQVQHNRRLHRRTLWLPACSGPLCKLALRRGSLVLHDPAACVRWRCLFFRVLSLQVAHKLFHHVKWPARPVPTCCSCRICIIANIIKYSYDACCLPEFPWTEFLTPLWMAVQSSWQQYFRVIIGV